MKLNFLGDAWTTETENNRKEKRTETWYLPAIENYQLLISVEAEDVKGNPCFRENSMVQFIVKGSAKILAVDSGNLMSSEPY